MSAVGSFPGGRVLAASLRDMLEWMTSEPVNDFLAESSLFFIFGGLAVLALIMFLVVLQRIVPESSHDPRAPADLAPIRALRPTPFAPPAHGALDASAACGEDLEARGRADAAATRAATWDDALRAVAERGLGEPRILRDAREGIRVRLYACAACAPGAPRHGSRPDCGYALGFLAGVLAICVGGDVQGREAACRAGLGSACEFEFVPRAAGRDR